MQPVNATIREYEELTESSRVDFLAEHIGELTDLSEHFLTEAIRFEASPLAKWFVIKGLGILKSVESIPLITQICKEVEVEFENTSLHSICAWSLGRIGEAAFVRVMGLLGDGDVETRRCAVDALGEIKDVRALEALCFSLECDERPVQLWAGLSLAKIGEDAVPALHELIARCEVRVRLIALDAIVKIGSNQSTPVLEELLRNGSPEDKRFIIEALAGSTLPSYARLTVR